MTREESGSGLVALLVWLKREELLGDIAKECLDFAIADLFSDKP